MISLHINKILLLEHAFNKHLQGTYLCQALF